MISEFTKIEFEKFLSKYHFNKFKIDWKYEDEKWNRTEIEIQEYCYLIILNNEYGLKLYSSVDRRTNNSRGYAEDAIRIVPVKIESLRPIRPPFSRINRGKNWRENFSKRISEILISLGNKNKCEKCRGKMILKKNRKENINFLGCSNWPSCNNSNSIIIAK